MAYKSRQGDREHLYNPNNQPQPYYPPQYNAQERFVKGKDGNYLNASYASQGTFSNFDASRDYSLRDIDTVTLPHDPRYPPYKGYNPNKFRTTKPEQEIDASTLTQPDTSRPNHYMALSLVALFLFGFILGGIAFAFSLMSRTQSKLQDYEKGRKYGRYAFWLAMSGIASGCVMWVIVLWVAYTSSFPGRYYWVNSHLCGSRICPGSGPGPGQP